jgi:glycosyltransferase involved in cell wall biosynthesis
MNKNKNQTVFFAQSVNVIGGAERVTIACMQSLVNDYTCMALAPKGGDLNDELAANNIPIEHIACVQSELTKPIATCKQFFDYFMLFKKHKPVAVHTGDILALRSLQGICRFMKIPLICHVHFPYDDPFIDWVFKGRPSPAVFIFCSAELKENLYKKLVKYSPNAAYKVIHNGVDTDLFVNKEPKNEKVKIGIVANLQERKGHLDFIEMASILVEKGLSAEFHIIGGDILASPRQPLLVEKVNALGLAAFFTFHGQVQNVLPLLHSLDILVCASHEEAFPISILEAMSVGLPIVATNVNGIPEAIEHNESGLLVAPFSPEQLASAVERLMQNPSEMQRLGSNARERVVQHFSKGAFNHKLSNIYKNELSL